MNRLALSASFASIGDLLAKQARIAPDRTAVRSGSGRFTYVEFDRRVTQLANYLTRRGVRHGDRIAIISENSVFFLELALAAARTGSILATLNWRLSEPEIRYCVDLVEPGLLFCSELYRDRMAGYEAASPITIDDELTSKIAAEPVSGEFPVPGPEDGCLIIYTSGTTGFPKAAVISHRAMVARLHVQCFDHGIGRDDTFLCWSPMFHTAAIELAVGTLMIGGNVVVRNGLDFDEMCHLLETETLSNLIFFPGMVDEVIEKLEQRRPMVKKIKKFGALADLFVPAKIARLTELLQTPYTNTFGMTECGLAPASAGTIPIGVVPDAIPKIESSFCDVRVFDKDDTETPQGEIGELVVRGPMLFSGYWADEKATADAFRGGWYHTGDMFTRNADGSLSYAGRSKYLIKSGGENIYPAEIERVVSKDSDVDEVVVVARPDPTWGEVPVAVVSSKTGTINVDAIQQRCASHLARFKRPKEIILVSGDFFERNNTGKIIRKKVEDWVRQRAADSEPTGARHGG